MIQNKTSPRSRWAAARSKQITYATNDTVNNRRLKSVDKLEPGYYRELSSYPAVNPVFIGLSFWGVNYIRNYGGVCLLCDREPSNYYLEFCNHREVWVLSSESEHRKARSLGLKLLESGASKVLLIGLNDQRILIAQELLGVSWGSYGS